MSTQASTFPAIPFTHTYPQRSLRLLELPPELLELLSSDNAPTLYLKSSNPSTTVLSTTKTLHTKGAESDYVHLCSSTRTYQVRQVSTSNSLFVTQPTNLLPQNSLTNGHNGETDAAHQDKVALSAIGALTAIGQVSSVLELHAVQLDVRALLKTLVPVWQWDDMGIPDRATRYRSKIELFDQIPAPEGHIEHAWRELLAFQLHGGSFVPDHKTLYQTWKQVMLKFNLNGGLGAVVGAQNFLEVDNNSEDDLNDGDTGLLNAVKRAIWWSPWLRKPTEIVTKQDEIAKLDRVMTTAWVGKLVLRNMAKGDQAVDADQFMTLWRNLLPEQWGLGLGFEILEVNSYQLGTDLNGQRTIIWLGEDGESATWVVGKEEGGLESAAKGSKTGAGLVGKRKWHDKFKDSRNVKR